MKKKNTVKKIKFQAHRTEKLLVLIAKFGNKTENPAQGEGVSECSSASFPWFEPLVPNIKQIFHYERLLPAH